MANLRRDIKRGECITVHLLDGKSAAGRVVRCSRHALHLVEQQLEMSGVMHELTSQRLIIPMDVVKAVEVRGS